MSPILMVLLRYTVGVVFSKVRNEVAMALRDGDVTDQEVYSLVVDEFDNLKSKLNALSMRN